MCQFIRLARVRTHKLCRCHDHQQICTHEVPVCGHHIVRAKMGVLPLFRVRVWPQNEPAPWILCYNLSIHSYSCICRSNCWIWARPSCSFCTCARHQSKWHRSHDAAPIGNAERNGIDWKQTALQTIDFNSVGAIFGLPDLLLRAPLVYSIPKFRFVLLLINVPWCSHKFWSIRCFGFESLHQGLPTCHCCYCWRHQSFVMLCGKKVCIGSSKFGKCVDIKITFYIGRNTQDKIK